MYCRHCKAKHECCTESLADGAEILLGQVGRCWHVEERKLIDIPTNYPRTDNDDLRSLGVYGVVNVRTLSSLTGSKAAARFEGVPWPTCTLKRVTARQPFSWGMRLGDTGQYYDLPHRRQCSGCFMVQRYIRILSIREHDSSPGRSKRPLIRLHARSVTTLSLSRACHAPSILL